MKLMVKITLLLFVVVLIILIPSVTLLWQNQQRTLLEQAHIRAQTIHQMIVITRQWVAENRDRIEPVPAVATKELSRYADYMASFKFHITSDKLINPENKPTDFEIEAMQAMKNKGMIEYARLGRDNGTGKIYLYAAPLFINQSCLSCHGVQDYKIDDFRGLISITIPLGELEKSLERNSITMFYTIAVFFITILIMISLLIHRLVIRHITALTNAAKDVRQGIRVCTNIKTDDEIQNLSEAFDLMSSQIASNEETLKAKLDEAVSKYVELVKELEIKNKTLGSLNQLKTDLLDSVSHEIRTPLTKILSYSELLNDSRILQNDEIRSKFALSMKTHINTIKTMFNDIITLSRLEHEQHIYHKIPLNLRNMVIEFLELFELDIKSKNLKPIVDIGAEDIIHVDGETFASVISNVISNAVKYSKPDGDIIIRASTIGDDYIITCLDHGVGIPPDDLGKIFIRFHRGSNAKKEFSGTGLGLSIVERIISAHNGQVTIDSVENEYTIVTITLPK